MIFANIPGNKATEYAGTPLLTSIIVSPSTATIQVGGTQSFTATPKDQNGNTMTGISINWTSSNIPIAIINSSGVATGIAQGASTITASSGGVSGKASLTVTAQSIITNIDLRYHKLVVDDQNKILPWYSPSANAYDHFLSQLWTWLPTVPNGPASSLPMYYLYCGFRPGTPITPDTWENDWGERVPNFVEFGRLYYAYTGDMRPLNISKGLIDYALAHAITPSNYNWPNFPIGTANGGDTQINGDNVAWAQDDVLIDLGSDMGMSFYKMYLIYGDPAYRTAAINTANTLVSKIQTGTATDSPWPYVVNARTGAIRSRYTSNFAGTLTLFDLLIENNEPNTATYITARQTLKNWILQYPMQNGNWVDGHSDNYIDGTDNWENSAKSNMNLYLLDNPSFDPNFQTDVPKLLKWTEDNFVNVPTPDGLPGQYYGAYVPAEQFRYMYRMGYQTSRQAAEYARWYAVTGDATYKDRAYRGFNYNTYMMKTSGEAADGPTETVGYWWGDIYGEGARMYFHGFSAVPEWAPPRENHILYSNDVLKNIAYASTTVNYTATGDGGTDYLRLTFLPGIIRVNGSSLPLRADISLGGYTVRDLGNGDYSVNIKRAAAGDVYISSYIDVTTVSTPTFSPAQGTYSSTQIVTISSATTGATIYYTTDGSTPTNSSSVYSSPLTISATTTIKALAVKSGYTDSSISSATYAIAVPVLTSITVNPSTASIGIGSTQIFTATPKDQFGNNMTGITINWTTSNASIATINSSGFATAVAAGSSNITASSGGVSGTSLLTVTLSRPIAYWKFDETSGTIASDSSGNNHPSTLIGSPAWTTGKINGGLSFNGINSYVSVGGGTGNLAIDGSSPATVKSNAQTLTTASFTPPVGSVLYITVVINSNNNNRLTSITDNRSTHLPYTKQASYGTENGYDAIVYLYTASVTTSQAMTVSAVQSAPQSGSSYAMMKVLVVTGANTTTPVGAKGGGRGATGVISDTYISTSKGSWGWLIYGDWTQKAIPTAGTNQTTYDSYTVSGEDTYALIRQNSMTANTGTSVTMSTSAPTSGAQIAHLYFEMVPAPEGSDVSGVHTISFWAKPNTITQSIIDMNGIANIKISSGIVRANSFTSPFIYVDGVQSTNFPNTNWHLVTVTTGTAVNATAFNVGKIGVSYYDGLLDDVRVYDLILPLVEIQTLYSAGTKLTDVTPPSTVTSLTNSSYSQNYIRWTWTDPIESDFDHVEVYLDSAFKTNITKNVQVYNTSGMSSDTAYTISLRTVDTSGNINKTWINHTARTAPAPPTPIPSNSADVNLDGIVDIFDLVIVSQHFGENTSAPYPRHDVNADGKIDILDLILVSSKI